MSTRKIYAGETSQSLPIFIRDTTSTTGGGLSGVTTASAGLIIEWRRQGQSTWTQATPAQLSAASGKVLGTFTAWGIVADGGLAGAYELDLPDAAYASGVEFVVIRVRGVASMLPVLVIIELDAVNYQDSVGFGLSRINTDIASRASQISVDGKPTLTQIEASTVLAKEATVNTRASQVSVNNIPTNPLLTDDGRLDDLNTIVTRVFLIPTNPLLANDSRLNFLDASVSATTSNILSAITGLNNLSAKCNLFGASLLEAPETGSTIYEFTLVVKDDEDKLVNLDSAPSISAVNGAGTSRSGNLSTVTNPNVGRYRFTYTVSSSHSREPLRIEAIGTTSTETRYAIWAGAVVDYDVTTVLQQISTDLSQKPTLAQIEAGTMSGHVTDLANRLTVTRAGFLDGMLLADNYNTRVVKVTGAKHVAADVHETQPASYHISTFDSNVYDTISTNMLSTVHTGIITPGTVAQTLNSTNASLSTLLARIPTAITQLVADLSIMLVNSGNSLVRWTANALSLAPTGSGGGGGGTIIATVTVPQILEHTAFNVNELVMYRGCYWSFQVQNLGSLSGYTELWFSLRKRQDDKEVNSALLISMTQGLLIANGEQAKYPNQASLTFSQDDVTIQVHQDITQFVAPSDNYSYDIKGKNQAGHTVMLHESELFRVKRDITRRV
jgi:hypothetical protein